MASISEYHPLSYHVYQPSNEQETCDPPPTSGVVELIDLTITIRRTYIHGDYRSRRIVDVYSHVSREALCLDLNVLKTRDSFYQRLAPALTGIFQRQTSRSIRNVIDGITEAGLQIDTSKSNRGSRVPLMAEFGEIVVVHHLNRQEDWINRASSESEIEFEANNNGMVPAKESSVKKMLKKVNFEVRDQACIICLTELEVNRFFSDALFSHFPW